MQNLSKDEQFELEDLFQLFGENQEKLNQWELGFFEDNQRQYENNTNYSGTGEYFVSDKMWGIFRRIRDKINGES